ncbi:hypothetical protein EG832_19110 [bacterium]|nr:hypothetical protein [bacterium]
MESNPLPPAPKSTNKHSTEITAAIITGIFGLVTVLISTVVPKVLPDKKETPQPTATAVVTPTFSVTPSLASSSSLATDVVLVANLSESQQELINTGYSAALELANQLPLMIRDEFDTRDYGWIEAPRTEYETNFCEFKLENGAYHLLIETKNASGSCWTTAPRSAIDFLLSTEILAAARQDLTTDMLFRFQDWITTIISVWIPTISNFLSGNSWTGFYIPSPIGRKRKTSIKMASTRFPLSGLATKSLCT